MSILTAQDRVIGLLRTLDDARHAWDTRSSGGGALLMPTMWGEGSYAELERCLLLMREGGEDTLLDPATGRATFGADGFPVTVLRPPQRRLWWHVCSRYRWGDERVLLVHVQRSRQGPQYLMPPHTELVAGAANVSERRAYVRAYCWSEHVRPKLVTEGIDVLTSLMHGGRNDRIMLPEGEFRRAMGLPLDRNEVEEMAVA